MCGLPAHNNHPRHLELRPPYPLAADDNDDECDGASQCTDCMYCILIRLGKQKPRRALLATAGSSCGVQGLGA